MPADYSLSTYLPLNELDALISAADSVEKNIFGNQ